MTARALGGAVPLALFFSLLSFLPWWVPDAFLSLFSFLSWPLEDLLSLLSFLSCPLEARTTAVPVAATGLARGHPLRIVRARAIVAKLRFDVRRVCGATKHQYTPVRARACLHASSGTCMPCTRAHKTKRPQPRTGAAGPDR